MPGRRDNIGQQIAPFQRPPVTDPQTAPRVRRMVYWIGCAFAILLVAIVLIPIVALALLSASAKRPDNLGVKDGKLAPCPDSPNCVSTQADDKEHRMEPIPLAGTTDEAIERIKAAVAREPGMEIVTEEDGYLHAEATSRVFRFVDDVEFFVDEDAQLTHFRSASRVGHGDMGVNRARMQRLRKDIESP
jgi:uncharacterized protein (DUF1499 family)